MVKAEAVNVVGTPCTWMWSPTFKFGHAVHRQDQRNDFGPTADGERLAGALLPW